MSQPSRLSKEYKMSETITIPLTEYKQMLVANTRMETALQTIRTHARNAAFGGWRHDINAMASKGLNVNQ